MWLRGFRRRLAAMISKEVLQLRRDRLTFAMMFGLPILQLLLFGYAIDTDPRHLPTAVLAADQSQITRTILSALGNTGYMRFTHRPRSEAEANELLQSGEVQFVVTIPSDFTRRLVRGERAQVLIDADATDPIAAANPLAAAAPAISQALARDLVGPLIGLRDKADAVDVVLQRRYNPEGKSRLNIVPGLLAVILTMTMVMMTALAVTRERERGTMENLLAMPVRPIEVMIGKIVPYIAIGAVQVVVILLVAWLLFGVGVEGSLAAVLPRHGAVHHRQPGHRLHHLDADAEPAAGHAGLVLPDAAVDPAVGLPVPVPRHAGLGAMDRRGAAGDPFHEDRARRDAERRRLRQHLRRAGRAAGDPADRVDAGDQPLPGDAGLRAGSRGRQTTVAKSASSSTVPPTPAIRAISGALPRKASARQDSTSMMCRMANSTSLLKLWNVFSCARKSWLANSGS